ncbi:MAG: mechanosensitive ion channel family protein [Bacteroidota bacterium]
MQKFTCSLFFFLLITTLQSVAQVDADNPFSNPRSALTYFFANLQDDNFNPQLAGQIMRSGFSSEESADQLAIELKQLLDGEGHYIYLDEVPEQDNYRDSISNKYRYVLVPKYPNLYLSLYKGNWKFGQKSINEIEVLHKKVFRFGLDSVIEYFPNVGTRKVLGLRLWQYVATFFLIFLSFVVHKILSGFFKRGIIRLLIKTGRVELADKYVKPVARPLSVFFVLWLIVVLIPILQLPADISRYIILGLKALTPFYGTIVFYRLVNVLAYYLHKVASRTESTLDDQLVPLLRKAMKTFVVIIGAFVILENLNVPILPLLTGLSIGGLAFALAAQDTIKNFFGSLMIFVDKPFQIGDWVTSGEIDGTVEEVGFRSTRVRTFRNSVVYVPNGKLADSTIDNHGLRQYRRFYTQIALTYDTPPHLIETFVNGLRKIVEDHPKTRKDYYNIYFNDMASFSLNVMFYIFFAVPNWPEELKARHEILLEIMKLAEELGINFAFPTQTLHMENFPGQPSLSPSYSGKDESKMKLEEYFRT